MPIIDANGKLFSPLFIVMKEVTGDTFGPQVQRDLFTAPNTLVTASSSGKMKKEHLKVWLEEVFFPHVGDRTVLVIDSWSTYKNTALLDAATPEGRHVQIVTVPPKTTPLCQPLDVFGFRMWKTFVRKIWDWVVRDDIQCELHLRNAALKLQSLVHNQFSSPRFREMWKVGWTHPGYFENDEHVEFKTPSQFCFESDAAKENHRCSVAPCEKTHFLTCAWCKATLCFEHFFQYNHFCEVIN
ncbi:hypothetical protein BV898_04625 [Hypsibius exemplaris]|uniref:DDE-1 domain-containing protein n=1 Tax=Hypsibius exemplaris TaxID=2072580 RepID=A0A1W0X1S4_HYPEX|nr:hypothetical protein BV898_04625 [Hypsibius exemplaris]